VDDITGFEKLEGGNDLLALKSLRSRKGTLGHEHCPDQIPGCKDKIDQIRRDRYFPGTDAVKDALDVVGESSDLFKSEHRSGALDGMHGAEESVEGFPVSGIVLKIEDGFFDHDQVLLDFLAVGLNVVF